MNERSRIMIIFTAVTKIRRNISNIPKFGPFSGSCSVQCGNFYHHSFSTLILAALMFLTSVNMLGILEIVDNCASLNPFAKMAINICTWSPEATYVETLKKERLEIRKFHHKYCKFLQQMLIILTTETKIYYIYFKFTIFFFLVIIIFDYRCPCHQWWYPN